MCCCVDTKLVALAGMTQSRKLPLRPVPTLPTFTLVLPSLYARLLTGWIAAQFEMLETLDLRMVPSLISNNWSRPCRLGALVLQLLVRDETTGSESAQRLRSRGSICDEVVVRDNDCIILLTALYKWVHSGLRMYIQT